MSDFTSEDPELADGVADGLADAVADGLALELDDVALEVALGDAVESSSSDAVEELPLVEPETAEAEVLVADGEAVEPVTAPRPLVLVVTLVEDDVVALGDAVASSSSSSDAVEELPLVEPETDPEVEDADAVGVVAPEAVRPALPEVEVGDALDVTVEVAEGDADVVAVGEADTVGLGVGVGVEVAAGTSPAAVTLSSSSCARRPIRDSVAASAAIAMTAATTQRALLPLAFSLLPFSPLSSPPPGAAAGPSGLDTVAPQVARLNKIRL